VVGCDLVAGLTLLAIAVPEQIGTARLAVCRRSRGSTHSRRQRDVRFAGSNPQMSVGADSTIAPLFAVGVATVVSTVSPDYVALVGILAVLVGVIVALVGLLRLGGSQNFCRRRLSLGSLAGLR